MKDLVSELAIYQEVPVSDDEVSQAGDEEYEVDGGKDECDGGDKHHPALQQRHGDVGRNHQDEDQTTKKLLTKNRHTHAVGLTSYGVSPLRSLFLNNNNTNNYNTFYLWATSFTVKVTEQIKIQKNKIKYKGIQ